MRNKCLVAMVFFENRDFDEAPKKSKMGEIKGCATSFSRLGVCGGDCVVGCDRYERSILRICDLEWKLIWYL